MDRFEDAWGTDEELMAEVERAAVEAGALKTVLAVDLVERWDNPEFAAKGQAYFAASGLTARGDAPGTIVWDEVAPEFCYSHPLDACERPHLLRCDH